MTITKDRLRSILEQIVINFLSKFFTFLYSIPFSANFLIFIFVSKAFRSEMKSLFYRMIGKQINSIPINEQVHQENPISTILLPN